jgi:AmiR/NasT family two-component response regulator
MTVADNDASAGLTPAVLLGEHEPVSELAAAYAEISQLRKAIASNRDIGAATGVVMVQYSLTQSDAFELLRRVSQASHRKLYDVALDVLESGTLPAAADSPKLSPRPRPPSP